MRFTHRKLLFIHPAHPQGEPFSSISVLVSVHREWFGFIYALPGSDKVAHFLGPGLLAFCMILGFSSLAFRVFFRGQNEAFREARTNEVIAQTMCSVARVSNVIRRYFGTDMGVLSPENNPFLRQVSSDFRELFRSGPVYPAPYGFIVTTN